MARFIVQRSANRRGRRLSNAAAAVERTAIAGVPKPGPADECSVMVETDASVEANVGTVVKAVIETMAVKIDFATRDAGDDVRLRPRVVDLRIGFSFQESWRGWFRNSGGLSVIEPNDDEKEMTAGQLH